MSAVCCAVLFCVYYPDADDALLDDVPLARFVCESRAVASCARLQPTPAVSEGDVVYAPAVSGGDVALVPVPATGSSRIGAGTHRVAARIRARILRPALWYLWGSWWISSTW